MTNASFRQKWTRIHTARFSARSSGLHLVCTQNRDGEVKKSHGEKRKARLGPEYGFVSRSTELNLSLLISELTTAMNYI